MTIAWSYSRLQTYQACPRQFKFSYVDKVPREEGPALKRGQDRHELLEKHVKGERVRFPKDLARIRPELDKIRKLGARAELELAFTAKWDPTGWFDKDAWLRIKIDLQYRQATDPTALRVCDYKTGRIRPEQHEEQLRLYGLATMMTEPKASSVTTEVWYVDHEPAPRPLATQIAPNFQKAIREQRTYWERKVRPLLKDKRFTPTPGHACGWCPYSWRKRLPDGSPGPCKDGV